MDMHYILFLGIFGLPVVAGVGMLVARVWDTFAPEDAVLSGRIPEDDLYGTGSHASDLADAFFADPVDQNPKQ
jgi:hypothetical protein